jgi:glutathione peroxidase-family protein
MNIDICPELFPGDDLPIEFILFYLCNHSSPGVQAFLINKLYQVNLSEVNFYLPQLVRMSISREDYGAYSRFFIDIASRDYLLGVKMYWIFQAQLKTAKFSLKVEEISHNLEKIIVQRPGPLFDLPFEGDLKVLTEACAEYFSDQYKFIHTLAKISILLIKESEDKDSTLKAYLTYVDTWVKEIRFWYSRQESDYVKRLFRGIVLPLDGNGQVVRIPSEEAKCFKTKARVPYKVVFEVISILESDPSHSEEPGQASPPEDILESLTIDSDSIIDKEEARFEGFEEYANKSFDKDFTILDSPCNSFHEDPWGEKWKETKLRIKASSPFGNYQSWDAKAYIVKGHDDLRQELLAMQLIRRIHDILQENQISTYLRPYEILIVSDNAGIIECIPDAVSLHTIKKSNKPLRRLFQIFQTFWASRFEEAQKNFVESSAGYSLVCYLLNLKDRHNGNILLDSEGHIIHIDFGFFLTNSPGKLNMESAPFKLTKEMIELMGGYQGEMFNYFVMLFYKAFLVLRKYSGELSKLVEMMMPAEDLPCFYDSNKALKDFRARFCLDVSDEDCLAVVRSLVVSAAENWRTEQYDVYQWITNNILY